jgi:hypothetical protein
MVYVKIMPYNEVPEEEPFSGRSNNVIVRKGTFNPLKPNGNYMYHLL